MHHRKKRRRIRPRQPPPRPPRVLICGAKGVGKSTMLRCTVNRLLSSTSAPAPAGTQAQVAQTPAPKVMVLDCDAGQPELSPPGMLSLTAVSGPMLSPPHSHVVVSRRQRGTTCGDGTGAGSGTDTNVAVACASDSAPGGADGDGDGGETVKGTRRIGGGGCGDSGIVRSDDQCGRGICVAVDGHKMAYYYGYLTSRVDPARYLQMVSDLVAAYDGTIDGYYESSSRFNNEEGAAYVNADPDDGDDCSYDIEDYSEGDRNIKRGAESSPRATMDTDDDRAPPWPPPSPSPPLCPPPLVVNTDGWVKSMGAEILGAVIDAVRPDHVFQIVGSKRSKRFDLSQVLLTVSYAAVATPPSSDPMMGARRYGEGEDGADAAACHPMLHVVDSFDVGETAVAAPEAEATVSLPLPPRQEHSFEEEAGGNTSAGESKSSPHYDPLTPEDDAGGPSRSEAEYGLPDLRPSPEYDGIDASPDRCCLEIAGADVNVPPASSLSRPDPVPHPSSPLPHTFRVFIPPPPVSSAHLRTLRLCCYFLGGARNLTLLEAHFDPRRGGIVDKHNAIARALAAEAPHAVPFDAVRCVILGEEGEALGSSTELVLDVLNGSVVGLCVSDPGLQRGDVSLGENDDDGDGGANASSSLLRCPSHGPCVGLGIVRAVYHRNKCEGEGHGTTKSSTTTGIATLFVLTPVGCDALHHVDTLVVGRVTLPVECGYRGGAYSESCPFYNLQQD